MRSASASVAQRTMPAGSRRKCARAICRYFASGAPRDKLTCSSDAGGSIPVFDSQGLLVKMSYGKPDGLLDALNELVHPDADGTNSTHSAPSSLRAMRSAAVSVYHHPWR
jgi:hypothetical protein